MLRLNFARGERMAMGAASRQDHFAVGAGAASAAALVGSRDRANRRCHLVAGLYNGALAG
jgi:hypothetical protein